MELALNREVTGESPRLYLPALDGLRFFAFLLVLVHHTLPLPDSAIMRFVEQRGWMGVELFFAISAYLFFYLLSAEAAAKGSINVLNFYARRLLRLYPLMVAFPLVMLLRFGPLSHVAIGRFLGIAAFIDNFLTWSGNFNPIFASAHLWTLPYEFQIYLVIPLAFLLFKTMGAKRFLWLLASLWVVAVVARLAFILVGARHPIIWVTPFLRPESTIVGMALGIGLLMRAWAVALVGILSIVAFILLPNVDQIGISTMAIYPVGALMCGALLWATVNVKAISTFLSQPWIVFLGKISFGLYVYHLFALWLTNTVLLRAGMPLTSGTWNYSLRLGMTLVVTVVISVASYFLFERYFLRLKMRFSAIESRPI